MIVGSLLGLAEAMLALDLDVVETVFEGETHDLVTLGLSGPVGDQRQLGAQLLQPVEGLVAHRGTATIPRRAARYRRRPMRHRSPQSDGSPPRGRRRRS